MTRRGLLGIYISQRASVFLPGPNSHRHTHTHTHTHTHSSSHKMHLSAFPALITLSLLTSASALCKPMVGISVYRDDWAFTIPCGRNDCNSPATTITIFHEDRTTTSVTVPGSIGFGFSETPKLSVHEWDFYGKYREDPGLGFHVYATRCPPLPRNHGGGCYERALKVERGLLPKATWTRFRCGTTW